MTLFQTTTELAGEAIKAFLVLAGLGIVSLAAWVLLGLALLVRHFA